MYPQVYFFILIICLLLASIPDKPPEFPDLPPGYTDWQYNNEVGITISDLLPEDSVRYYRLRNELMDDPAFLPFSLDYSGYDSIYGNYYRDSTVGHVICKKTDRYPGIIEITWSPHLENKEIMEKVKYPGRYWLSFHDTDWNNIYINTLVGKRIHGWSWDVACDGTYHAVSSFTKYYIPTSSYDFFITCENTFYIYEEHPDPCDGSPEECDSLYMELYGEEGWKPVRTWPDRIRELERAVERTFRVKE